MVSEMRSGRDYDENVFADDEELSNMSITDLMRAEAEGKGGWGEIVDFSTRQNKAEAIKALEELKKAGFSEDKHIRDLLTAKSDHEIRAKLDRIHGGLVNHIIRNQIGKSLAFKPVLEGSSGKEQEILNEEIEGLQIYYKEKVPLTGKFSLVTSILRFEEDIKPRLAFREKLKKQSKTVQKEYLRRLPELSIIGSKEKLLDDVISNYAPVKDAPEAVQHEFEQKQSADSAVSTEKIKSEVLEKYNKMAKKYKGNLMKNIDAFGGRMVNDPELGEVPETAKEFWDWFKGLENFAEVKWALDEFPNEISKRKSARGKAKKILDQSKSERKPALEKLVHDMHQSELESYLPTLEESVKNNSEHVAEFEGVLLTAKSGDVPVFNPLERITMVSSFKGNDLEVQEAKLKVLKHDVAEGTEVINQYKKLDEHLRDDSKFFQALMPQKKLMLEEAKESAENEGKGSLVDLGNKDTVGQEEIDYVADTIEDGEADDFIKEAARDQEIAKREKAVKVRDKVRGKMGNILRAVDNKGLSQLEASEEETQRWLFMDKEIKTEDDAKRAGGRQLGKLRFMQKYRLMQRKFGRVMHIGGQVKRRMDYSYDELKEGRSESITRKLEQQQYGEDGMIEDQDKLMAQDPTKMLDQMDTDDLQAYANLVQMKLAKRSNAKVGNTEILARSTKIQEAIKGQVQEKLGKNAA